MSAPVMGKVVGLDAAAYHAHPGVNASLLKEMARSPFHAWAKYVDPNRVASESTKSQALGTAIHCAILEPDEFPKRYMVAPEKVDRRTKEGKELWAKWEAESEGAIVLPAQQRLAIEAVAKHPLAASYFAHGEAEVSWFVADPDYPGVTRKCRTDWMTALVDKSTAIVDLKSTKDASPGAFGRDAGGYGYHVQAAWYLDTVALCGTPVDWYFLIAVENSAPYAVGIYHVDDAALMAGREIYQARLAEYAECVRRGTWPHPADQVRPLTLPPWAMRSTTTEVYQ